MAEAEAVAGLVAEKRKLKKSLFRFDMIFFTVCAIVALDTIGQSSSYGAQAVFWLIISGWLGGTLTATTIAALDALWGSSFTGNQGAETVIGFLFIWGAVIM